MKVGIFYLNDEIEELYKNAGVQTEESAGYDLVCVEDYEVEEGKQTLISLGVVLNIPDGHYIQLVPRSSIFKKNSVLQANSIGTIDKDYCGINDVMMLPVVSIKGTQTIKKGTRLCQILLREVIPIEIYKFTPKDKNRGGFGTTGA